MSVAAHIAVAVGSIALLLALAALNHRIGSPATAGFCLGIAASIAIDAAFGLPRIVVQARRLAELEARLRAGSGR